MTDKGSDDFFDKIGKGDFDDFFKKNGMGGLFGEGLFGNQPGPKTTMKEDEQSNKLTALTRELQKSINLNDVDFLKEAIVTYRNDIHSSGDVSLLKLHAKAALLVGEHEIAYKSLSRIIEPEDDVRSVLGMMAYFRGEIREAFSYLSRLESRSECCALALSSIHYDYGNKDPKFIGMFLDDIVEGSPEANLMMGALFFESGVGEIAAKYIQRAIDLNPKFVGAHLDRFKLMMENGKEAEVYAALGGFIHSTETDMSIDQIQREISSPVTFPSYSGGYDSLHELLN